MTVLGGSTAHGAVTLLGDIRVKGGGTLTGRIDNKGDLHFDSGRPQRVLIGGTAQLGGKGIGTDILRGIEHVAGGRAADSLTGNGTANRLEGNGGGDRLKGLGGADTLLGGSGNDRLTGGTGKDVLTGDAGADVFVLDAALKTGNVDQITDFDTVADSIALAGSAFGALGGRLSGDAFKIIGISGARVDADDRLIYDSGSGELLLDANGSGAGVRKLIALIGAGLDLTAGHFDLLS